MLSFLKKIFGAKAPGQVEVKAEAPYKVDPAPIVTATETPIAPAEKPVATKTATAKPKAPRKPRAPKA